jgi:hypothetical protein
LEGNLVPDSISLSDTKLIRGSQDLFVALLWDFTLTSEISHFVRNI